MALADYKDTVTSHDGEDGILRHIFTVINVESRFCVEFGAWDGKHLSNVWDLWHNQDWGALLIEGDAGKAAKLREAIRQFPKVSSVCAYVSDVGPTSLDALLEGVRAPNPVDLLSIDIDGNDFAVWKATSRYQARVVVIEYNCTIPLHIAFVGTPQSAVGSSARALVQLGREKGYELVACTKANLIFVRADLFPALGLSSNRLDEVFDDHALTYVISSFTGEVMLTRVPVFCGPGGNMKDLVKMIVRNPAKAFGVRRKSWFKRLIVLKEP